MPKINLFVKRRCIFHELIFYESKIPKLTHEISIFTKKSFLVPKINLFAKRHCIFHKFHCDAASSTFGGIVLTSSFITSHIDNGRPVSWTFFRSAAFTFCTM